jgi:hypothetical protein
MIYPSSFPRERESEDAEKKVFERLKQLPDIYDVFYSRKFITDGVGKKPEFEIDFIISIPEKAIICLEVKGGLIDYNGSSDRWTQNSRPLSSPISQISGSTHSFINLHRETLSDLPIMWALCFPDCEVSHAKQFPSSLSESQVIDSIKLLHIEHALEDLFAQVIKTHANRRGIKRWQYEKFKKTLLRGLGFVQTLGTRIKYDHERFLELTERQLRFFEGVRENHNLLIDGPAGSGKTIIAKTLAQDFLSDGKSVLFMCYNRTLANKIRYEFDRNEKELKVCTFHSLARETIDHFEPNWWGEVDKSGDDFWELEVPAKLDSFMEFVDSHYDVLIIDEGQDFKAFWFDLVFQFINPQSRKFIFMDKFQDIFGHFEGVPDDSTFSKYHLRENCRNTKSIVSYLESILNQNIETFDRAPDGEGVSVESFDIAAIMVKWLDKELRGLFSKEKVKENQVLLILNSSKNESSLATCEALAGMPLKALDNKARFQTGVINYSTINTFKGLEVEVVFVIDANLNEAKAYEFYTECSRAISFLQVCVINR